MTNKASLKRGTLVVVLLVAYYSGESRSARIPASAVCRTTKLTTDCSHLRLYQVPTGIPKWTKVLILSHNSIPKLTGQSFQHLANLEHLDLSFNSVSQIEAGTFLSTPRLRTLLMRHNEVTKSTLRYNPLRSLTNLTELDLAHNRLVTMAEDTFAGVPQLQILNLAENGLESVQLGHDADLRNLKVLNISKNQLSDLNEGSFSGLRGASLSVVDLSDNQISNIENGTFLSVKSIRTLNVSGSFKGDVPQTVRKLAYQLKGKSLEKLVMKNLNIQKIDAGMFAGFATEGLEHLDLSCNNITVLTESSSFIGLEELRHLYLDDNNLHHFDSKSLTYAKSLNTLSAMGNRLSQLTAGMFLNMTHVPLKYLLIRYNQIANIQPGAFHGLGNLLSLDLYYNALQQVVGPEHFLGLDKIERIDLAHNRVGLRSGTFSKLQTLKKLYLNLNLLIAVKVRPSPFANLTSLKVLDLGNNNMNFIDEDAFVGLVSLETLYLQHNNLAGIWKKSHPGGPLLMLQNLTRLERLHLGWNGFDNVPEGAFKNLSSLKCVSLQYNNINSLPDDLFADSTKIEQLELQNNQITLVNRSNLEPFLGSLKSINVAFNPLSCSCGIEWFRKWVDTADAEVVNVDTYECFSPPELYKSPFLEYHPSPWLCDHVLPMWAWEVIGVCLLVVAILIATSIRYRWYLKYAWYYVKARVNNYSALKGKNCEYKYDAFVSHSSKDDDWVNTQLVPNIEQCNPPCYRLCISDRDFTAGKAILDNIVDAIEESRKTLCLVTAHFLSSEWCKFEKRMAMHRLFDDNKDVLILVFLEKVPEKKLSKYEKMHKLMKRKTYLEWPEDPEKRPAFWERLKSVLASGVEPQENVEI